MDIKDVSATCLGASVLSSGNTKCKF